MIGSDKKIPLVLITGFLGSGKTSLIRTLLANYSSHLRIAVVQNEFAASSIDGKILQDSHATLLLRELNTGSIFCSCLFSQFKEVVIELCQNQALDMVIVEATGIADPIGIAQLLEDVEVSKRCYLARILTVVDASRFLQGVSKIVGVRHQIQVADALLINKVDLVDAVMLHEVEHEIERINPLALRIVGSHGSFDLSTLLFDKAVPLAIEQGIQGSLSRCGNGGYVSKIFKTTRPVLRANLIAFLQSLGEETLRLKGFTTDEQGNSFIVQYLPEQIEILPASNGFVGNTELIAIGYKEPNFNLLKAHTYHWER